MNCVATAFRKIPQTNPQAEYWACQSEIDTAIQRVLRSGSYILGEEVRAFEEEFANYIGASHAVGVGSGTDALELALRACGVGAGDEVISVSHTATATIAAIERTGAQPVLVDVDPRRFTLAPWALAEALSPKTKAIVPVHLYGQPAEMNAVVSFARDHGLRIVEDCAQAHGAACQMGNDARWERTGTLGDAGAFSFYPTKNLGAIGDGGCVVTRDADIAEKVRLLRQYGWRDRYVSDVSGTNSRLDELQAAILRAKLPYLDHWNDERRRIAAIYDESFRDAEFVRPLRAADGSHVFHQYVIRLHGRDRIQEDLATVGVGTGVHYAVPIHRQPAYRAVRVSGSLEGTETLCSEILSLPMYPALSDDDARRAAAELLKIAR